MCGVYVCVWCVCICVVCVCVCVCTKNSLYGHDFAFINNYYDTWKCSMNMDKDLSDHRKRGSSQRFQDLPQTGEIITEKHQMNQKASQHVCLK